MDVQEHPKMSVLSITEFFEAAKNGKTEELLNEKQKELLEVNKQKHKKPVLSAKNILLFCAASIMGGYALRFGENHTKIGKDMAEMLQKRSDKLKPQIIEEKFATYDELTKMANIFS